MIVVLSDEQLEEVEDALASALETLLQYGDDHRLVVFELMSAVALVRATRKLATA